MQKLMILAACLVCASVSARVKSSQAGPNLAAMLLSAPGETAAFNPANGLAGIRSRGALAPGLSRYGQRLSDAIDAKRTSPVVMGESIRELRVRIGSVQNTKKITSAMKMVAAAKVRRAQEAVLEGRPFSQALEGIIGGILEAVKKTGVDAPLLQKRACKKVGLVVISGDRGLCGGYNSFAIKKTLKRMEELDAQGIEYELFLVGRKAAGFFEKRIPEKIIGSMAISQNPSADQAIEVAEAMLNKFYNGDLDRVEIIYTKFINLITNNPEIRTVVPLLPDGMEMEGDEVFKLSTKGGKLAMEKEKRDPSKQVLEQDTIFDQEPSEILNNLLPLYLNGQILRTLQEAVASELSSRMQAMQTATDNASELADTLSIRMNRARQGAITNELAELSAGAEAANAA